MRFEWIKLFRFLFRKYINLKYLTYYNVQIMDNSNDYHLFKNFIFLANLHI